VGATVAASLFSLLSLVCVAVLSALIIIMVIVKRKQHNDHEVTRRTTSNSRSTPSIYGHVHIVQRRPVSINTKSNIAYGPSVATPTTAQAQLESDTT
jgi:cytoskeletal protein RodZ